MPENSDDLQSRRDQQSKERRARFVRGIKTKYGRVVIGTSVGLIVVGGLLAGVTFVPQFVWIQTLAPLLRNIGSNLFVGGLATGVVYIIVIRRFEQMADRLYQFQEKQVRERLSSIEGSIERHSRRIEEHSNEIIDASSSLEALSRSGVVRIYASRNDAAAEMRADIESDELKTLRLSGISLNDFIRGDINELNNAWTRIGARIREGDCIDVKVMLIHPDSFGAILRQEGEERRSPATAGRLKNDIEIATREMLKLQEQASSRENTRFEARLYLLPPIMFLCQTDNSTYMHQYFFWPERRHDVSIPVMRFNRGSETRPQPGIGGAPYYPHEELTAHFDWIWRNASVPIEAYREGIQIGRDRSLLFAGASNVFYDHRRDGARRIRFLLENAKERVWLQGISLASFFERGLLFSRIKKLANKPSVDVQILLLDPESDQAKYRAYREYLLDAGSEAVRYDEYLRDGNLHVSQQLYRDTTRSIETIENMAVREDGRFSAKKYSNSPSCFVLIVDEIVLVEQYHYGKLTEGEYQSGPHAILGKDMVLVEYSRLLQDSEGDSKGEGWKTFPQKDPLYDKLRDHVKLLADHFRFVFDKCDAVPISKPESGRRKKKKKR